MEKRKVEKKKLNKKKVLILCVVMLLVIAVICVIVIKKQKNTQEPFKVSQNYEVLKNGIELNTSTKIAETKMLEELQINNIQITRNNEITTLMADVYNPTNSMQGGFSAEIIFKEEDGDEISKMTCYIGEIAPFGNTEIISSTTANLIDSYDVEFVKK